MKFECLLANLNVNTIRLDFYHVVIFDGKNLAVQILSLLLINTIPILLSLYKKYNFYNINLQK